LQQEALRTLAGGRESAVEIMAHLGMLGITLTRDEEQLCGKATSVVEFPLNKELYGLVGDIDITSRGR
jgi:hypothetical protein